MTTGIFSADTPFGTAKQHCVGDGIGQDLAQFA